MALADDIAGRLLDSIISGVLPAGAPVPAEAELAEHFGASRLTIREAIRVLRTQNIVRIDRGRGTSVNAPHDWASIDAIMRMSAGTTGTRGHVSEGLLEARRMIEIGAAQLAAGRRSDGDLAQLGEHIEGMRRAALEGDVDAFVAEDIAFHDVIMHASGNLFVPALFSSFGGLLIETRRQTSAVPAIRWNAIGHHVEILDALRTGDDELVRVAMEGHMEQTQRDLRQHVLGQTAAGAEMIADV